MLLIIEESLLLMFVSPWMTILSPRKLFIHIRRLHGYSARSSERAQTYQIISTKDFIERLVNGTRDKGNEYNARIVYTRQNKRASKTC